jgi:hypothetical protein
MSELIESIKKRKKTNGIIAEIELILIVINPEDIRLRNEQHLAMPHMLDPLICFDRKDADSKPGSMELIYPQNSSEMTKDSPLPKNRLHV